MLVTTYTLMEWKVLSASSQAQFDAFIERINKDVQFEIEFIRYNHILIGTSEVLLY